VSDFPPPSRIARLINSMIAPLAPGWALNRELSAAQHRVLLTNMGGHYDGAGRTARGKDFRINRTDAVEAMRADRDRLGWIGRDMLRNNPRVVKIRRQLVGNVVGPGIIPSVRWLGKENSAAKATVEHLIAAHCLSTAFDADGLRTIFGAQSLGFGSIVTDGEILFRRRYRSSKDGWPLNFQVQALEADFLNRNVDGDLKNGNYAIQGIEFNRIGRRVAYHLYTSHPGGRAGAMPATVRIDARHVIHAFDPQRAGQQRGVSWLAPVITLLHELQKYQDGQVKRQEVAAMFAGVLQTERPSSEFDADMGTLSPGALLHLGEGEEMTWTNPPSVDGYEAFMKVTDRTIAAGMGITYEALTGDYSGVNYTSGRMGRMDVDPNIRDWQNNLMIAQVCARFGDWIQEGIRDVTDIKNTDWEIVWTPPVRPVVDPTKDFKAAETAMKSGQKSRRQVIRESGGDPFKVEQEIEEERAWARSSGVVLTSDAGASASNSGAAAKGDTGKGDKKESEK